MQQKSQSKPTLSRRSTFASKPGPTMVKRSAAKANACTARKTVSKKKLTQRALEDAILRRCAKGRDQLDKKRAPGVKVVPVLPGSTGQKDFPRYWSRKEDGKKLERGAAEWYIPPGADPKRRMLFLHGGGFALWAPQDAEYRSFGSRLAYECNVCVLSVDYRLSPEFLFPAAYEDSVAALQWIVTHGPGSATEEVPATDVFVAGDSAGGCLALAVCVAPKASVRSVLRGTVGLSAWIDMTAASESYDTRQWDPARCFGDATNAGSDRLSGQGEAEVYLGRGGLKKHGRDWRASPLFAPAARLRKMPPVLLQVGDFELLLDENILLQKRMKKIGHSDATVSVYPRMWHCFQQYSEGGGVGQTLRKADAAMTAIGAWVRARKTPSR